jgi:heme/copper-type cytochrome/quinol oxidase subunit 2
VRRGAIISLVAIGAVVGIATTAIAIFVDWLPDQASEQRERIDFVFWLTTGICVAIFAIVAAAIIYSVW